MNEELLKWDIYEITTRGESVNGVMLRGRIRKLGLENGFNVLVENTSDIGNGVRFAVLNPEDATRIIEYVKSVVEGVSVDFVSESVLNPVLSKMKVNLESRYEL